MTRERIVKLAVAVAGAALLGAGLQKLPADFTFPQGDGSPGPVVFSHDTHVDAKSSSCLVCHAGSFRILEKGVTVSRAAITHKSMEAGGQCGSCHGKQAFGFDDCGMCHQE